MKAVVVVALLAVVAVVAFLVLGGGSFGVDGKNPLGTFEKIDAYARSIELEPAREPEKEHLARVFGAELAGREDVIFAQYNDRVPGYPHFLFVVRDRTGRVVAVAGQFQSQMFEFTAAPTNRTAKIVSALWKEVVETEPAFASRYFGTGSEQEYFHSEAAKGAVAATWDKNWGGGIKIAAQVTDLVVLKTR